MSYYILILTVASFDNDMKIQIREKKVKKIFPNEIECLDYANSWEYKEGIHQLGLTVTDYRAQLYENPPPKSFWRRLLDNFSNQTLIEISWR